MRVLCALALTLGMLAPAHAQTRPSFLILYTDDQRADCLGCAGHPLLKTPHIDRLAGDGVYFRNSFVTTSICCISRASLMTGMLCRHHQVGDFGTPLSPEVLAQSLPAQLKKAGYRTGCLGKWGIGGPPPKEVFDFWDAWGGQGAFFHDVAGKKVHNSEYLAMRAEEFLKGCKPDQPFCLFVLYKSPHEPFQPDPQDRDLFKDSPVPTPKTYSAEHFQLLPEFIRQSEGRSRLMKRHPTAADYPEFVKQYLRCLAGVDRSVGRIMQALADGQLDQNTLVVYSSDNGFYLGEHGLSGKWLMHEESIRVPLIVRYPKLPASMKGKRLDVLALNIDIAPTLLDFAGVAKPAGVDGQSLRPLLEGKETAWRQSFFYEHHFHYNGKIPRTEGVRTADWKYITYFDVKPAFEELYDLKNDPREENNLAGDPAQKARLEAMRKLYQEQTAKLPAPVLPKPAKKKE